MQSAIEYAAISTINLTPLFLVTNPLTNSSQSDTLQIKSPHSYSLLLNSHDILNIIFLTTKNFRISYHVSCFGTVFSLLNNEEFFYEFCRYASAFKNNYKCWLLFN